MANGTVNLSPACRADLDAIAVPRHASWDPVGLMAVRSYVRQQLATLGDVQEHHFRRGSHEGVNLILKLPGRNPRRRPLLVGAHYDGPLQSIGADDNASGVTALLELGRRWSAAPPRRPVWLVAFDLEEWGLLGSAALAEQLRAERQRLKLMVSLEMLAYTSEQQRYPHPAMGRLYGNCGDFIALVANARAGLSLARLTHALGQHVTTKALPVPRAGVDVPAVRLSDHSPFWDQGYNALMVTDTSFMRNPHYHQMSDTIDTLDLPFLASVIDGLELALGRL
jgi:Zn-dependent M28 family amino/carboxypeptidase